MTWKVTYRNKDGRTAAEEIQADSKKALFELLASRGLSAIRVDEVRGVVKGGQMSPRARTAAMTAAGLVVIVAVAVYFALAGRKRPHDSAAAKADEPPSQHVTALPPVDPEPAQAVVVPEKPKEPEYVEVNGRRVYRSATNDVGKVVTNAFGRVLVIERVVTPNGPSKDGKSLVPRRIFAYDSEVAIDALLNMDIGYKSLLMLPSNMDEDFAKSLTSNIVIEPDDTEDEVRRKKAMIAVKKELAERVAAGEKVSQIAAETLAHYNKIAEKRDLLMQEMIKLEDEGASSDEIEEAYEAANTLLKEYDALPLHSPKVRKAIIRERLDRKKARRNGGK